MAHTEKGTGLTNPAEGQENHTFQAEGADKIALPSGDFIADAAMTREGDDLILTTPSGETAVIEGYFNADPAPLLTSPDGTSVLTSNLVEAFAKSPSEFAANESANDQSPVGAVEEVKGEATVTRSDGTVEKITIGTPIYQGDIIETDANGAVNIVFMDETSMAVSENARLAINDYTFDPSTESGTTNFSVLRGLFVFTSGLIGRDDPDDVQIDTPVGSIGIRGTVIAGDINPGGESKITVLEGAIVIKNGLGDVTLSEQFETVRINSFDQPMENIGTVPANDIGTRFNSIGDVNPSLFTTINDAAGEQSKSDAPAQQNQPAQDTPVNEPQAEAPVQQPVQDIVTLDGNNTGLPPASTIAPTQNSTGGESPASTAPAATASAITPAAGPAPVTAETPPLPPSVTHTEPPGPGTATPPSITFSGGTIADTSASATLIGTVATGIAGAAITFQNGTDVSDNGYFELNDNGDGTATVSLTAAGAAELGSSLDVRPLGGFDIKVDDGTNSYTRAFSTNVIDAHNGSTSINLAAATGKVTIITDGAQNNAGYSISALGDINNDGFDDFVFGNNTNTAGQNHRYVFNGTGTLPASLPVGDPNVGVAGDRIDISPNPGSTGNFSESIIAGIGDFNGDGVEDYVLGQLLNNAGGVIEAGNAYIINGASGAALSFTSGTLGGSMIGSSVDGIGDINNDGYADVIIDAPGVDKAYLVEGRPTSWTGSLQSMATPLLDGTGIGFGAQVEGIGDFNGDGFSDFAVGAPGGGAAANDGQVNMYFGGAATTTAPSHAIDGPNGLGQSFGEEIINLGDFNGDGKTDILIGGSGNIGRIYMGSNGTPSSSVVIDVPNTYTVTGGNGVGDFNGDGFDDFVLTLGSSTKTNAYVVFGRGDAITNIDLAYLKNPLNALEIKYNLANSSHELEVSGISDINGDGYDDFAMGVPDANGGGNTNGNGGIAIVYGHNTGRITSGVTATADDQSLVGTKNNDVLNDGGFDGVSMRGGAGSDVFRLSNTNFLGLDGGGNAAGGMSNYDYIEAFGANTTLDFSDIDFEKMSGIEGINFTDNAQTIKLTLENLFNLMKTSDDGTFRISNVGGFAMNLILTDGNGTDNYAGGVNSDTEIKAMLDGYGGGNAVTGSETESGINYRSFEIGGYKLLIDNNIAVDAQ